MDLEFCLETIQKARQQDHFGGTHCQEQATFVAGIVAEDQILQRRAERCSVASKDSKHREGLAKWLPDFV
jgi:hypothetical protein